MNIDKQIAAQAKAPVEIVGQKEAKKTIRHLDTLKRSKGQKVWELNLKTKMITEAAFEEESHVLGLNGQLLNRKKVRQKPYCLYVVALNLTNAQKKFLINQLGNAR